MKSAVIVLVLLVARPVAAHDLRPGVLALVEEDSGDFAYRFVPPIDSRGDVVDVTVELPAACTRTAAILHCDGGLTGELGVRGMHGEAMRTLVVIERRDGTRAEWMLDAGEPRVALGPAPPNATIAWLWLGVVHILGGFDHLAFVIGLLLVLDVRLDRRLLLTISAFTIAHSLTLALAVLGVVSVPIAPVEACIAASVLLVAREATHRQPTAIRRWPWLAAAIFGLVHGLGFASALGEIGLPRAALAWSLLWFNIGVELGQLCVVATTIAVVAIARRLFGPHSIGERWVVGPYVHRAACYVLGALAAWWLLDRLVDVARGSG